MNTTLDQNFIFFFFIHKVVYLRILNDWTEFECLKTSYEGYTEVRSYCYGNEVRILFTDNVKYGICKQGKLIHCVDSDIIHRKNPNILLNFIPINNNKTRTL